MLNEPALEIGIDRWMVYKYSPDVNDVQCLFSIKS